MENKIWFVNSRGQIIQSLNPKSKKHELRISFGNAFETKEEAKIAKKAFKLAFRAEPEESKPIEYCPDILKHAQSCINCRTVIWQYLLKNKLRLED